MQHGELAIYSIGAVERMLDIPAATIRNWEERYGLVKPERSDGGHRLYTRGQVEQLRFVKEGLDRGLQPARPIACSASSSRRSGVASTDAREQAPRLLILLAERDPYAAEFAEFFLQTEGYEVALALDADDAALKLEQRFPSSR